MPIMDVCRNQIPVRGALVQRGGCVGGRPHNCRAVATLKLALRAEGREGPANEIRISHLGEKHWKASQGKPLERPGHGVAALEEAAACRARRFFPAKSCSTAALLR